jgi:hypothetical protein
VYLFTWGSVVVCVCLSVCVYMCVNAGVCVYIMRIQSQKRVHVEPQCPRSLPLCAKDTHYEG